MVVTFINQEEISILHHIAIGTKDPENLAEFYKKVPGLGFVKEFKDTDGSIRSVWLQIEESGLLMIEKKNVPKYPEALIFSLLDSHGNPYPIKTLRPHYFQKTNFTLYFLDPEGNQFGFSSYPEPLARFLDWDLEHG